jgi:predicted AlkP superfamily phosphohydrolase/phosphomutase
MTPAGGDPGTTTWVTGKSVIPLPSGGQASAAPPAAGRTRDTGAPGARPTALAVRRDPSPKPSLPLRLGTGSGFALLRMTGSGCALCRMTPWWKLGGGRVSSARRLVAAALVATAAASGTLAISCRNRQTTAHRVIVLGFDGMDYSLTRQLIDAGRLPNLARLERDGTYAPLGTAVPPQSPVAWSDFITGHDAGGHGIFDFIHRDPKTLAPYFSESSVEQPGHVLRLGGWRIPLTGGSAHLLRRGTAFWEVLEAHGIPTTIMRIPANFPPSGTATRELAGMGTPDILGTYGTFTFYTADARRFAGREIAGGKVIEAIPRAGVVKTALHGPPNPLRVKREIVTAPFTVYLDPGLPAATLVIGDERLVLQEGEWSDWVPVRFHLAPTQNLATIVRFYLKGVRPTFQLYVSPINLDPLDPALPISTPASFAAELAEAGGRYYTQGMPEDTHALAAGVFSPDEFLAQTKIVGDEVTAQYHRLLESFSGGLLFYYFSNTDLIQHMMFRPLDPGHPAYDAARDAPYRDVIPSLYASCDAIVGYTLAHIGPETTLFVMSDHGFASWRRAMNLNAWLRSAGYLAVRDPHLKKDPGMLANVDWSRTRAYGFGLNGLYVNLAGRERDGIVPAGERAALLDEIGARLLATVDPATGAPAVSHVYRSDLTYADGGARDIGPDMIVGYAKGTRCSDAAALGEVAGEVFSDNTGEWTGDHCMDPVAVPGILAANRRLQPRPERLRDLAAVILAELGVGGFPAGEAKRH